MVAIAVLQEVIPSVKAQFDFIYEKQTDKPPVSNQLQFRSIVDHFGPHSDLLEGLQTLSTILPIPILCRLYHRS